MPDQHFASRVVAFGDRVGYDRDDAIEAAQGYPPRLEGQGIRPAHEDHFNLATVRLDEGIVL